MDKSIKAAKQHLEDVKREENEKIRAAENKLHAANDDMNRRLCDADRELYRAQQKVNELEKEYERASFLHKIELETEIIVATLALKIAKAVVDGPGYLGATIAISTAKEVLRNTQYSSDLLLKSVELIVSSTIAESENSINMARVALDKIKTESEEYRHSENVKQEWNKAETVFRNAIKNVNDKLLAIDQWVESKALEAARLALKVAQSTVEVSLKAARKAMDVAATMEEDVLDVANWMVEHAGKIIDIHSIDVKGDLQNLFDSSLEAHVIGTFAGHDFNFNISFTVGETVEFIHQIFLNAMGGVKNGILPVKTKTSLPKVSIFKVESIKTQHPNIEVTVPQGYKIVGGGAYAHWSTLGAFLVENYPKNNTTWAALSKDHLKKEITNLTAYAIAIHDPEDRYEVRIFSSTSDSMNHPHSIVEVPSSYIMTGGGARVIDGDKGHGVMLTASFPSSQSMWKGMAKDHMQIDTKKIEVYAIGIKDKKGETNLHNAIVHSVGARAENCSSAVEKSSNGIMTGVGAYVQYDEPGNILTSSFPTDNGWSANSKSHLEPAKAQITTYAVKLQVQV